MEAEQLLQEGDPDGALAALEDRVRKAPEDPLLRVFLFQLLCVLGRWQRAIAQLKTCATLSPQAQTMAQMYRMAIICEVHREKVFRGEKLPLIFGEPEKWIAWMIEALKLQAQGDQTAAGDLRAWAFDAARPVPGTLNGIPFTWIADADPRLGPLLELIVNGRYFWAPFTAIQRIRLDAPADLRDRVWMPATVTWSNGGDVIALIPTRYPGTTEVADNQLRLAQATDWVGDEAQTAIGLGQRLLATDTADCALMDLRELVIGSTAAVSEPPQTTAYGHG